MDLSDPHGRAAPVRTTGAAAWVAPHRERAGRPAAGGGCGAARSTALSDRSSSLRSGS